MSKWITFQEQPTSEIRKTGIYNVISNEAGFNLGQIKWYGPWRCYSFFPSPNSVFEKTCLKDITSFIEKLMLDRKIQKQNEAQ